MKLTKIFVLISAFAIALFFQSCYYDKADLLYPNSSASECDTTAVSYNQKVVPLLTQQCYSCHTSSSAGGGIILGNYAADKLLADNGKLSGAIQQKSGFQPMPKGGAKMSSCQIAKIQRWIDAGTPNN